MKDLNCSRNIERDPIIIYECKIYQYYKLNFNSIKVIYCILLSQICLGEYTIVTKIKLKIHVVGRVLAILILIQVRICKSKIFKI